MTPNTTLVWLPDNRDGSPIAFVEGCPVRPGLGAAPEPGLFGYREAPALGAYEFVVVIDGRAWQSSNFASIQMPGVITPTIVAWVAGLTGGATAEVVAEGVNGKFRIFPANRDQIERSFQWRENKATQWPFNTQEEMVGQVTACFLTWNTRNGRILGNAIPAREAVTCTQALQKELCLELRPVIDAGGVIRSVWVVNR